LNQKEQEIAAITILTIAKTNRVQYSILSLDYIAMEAKNGSRILRRKETCALVLAPR
jgi:hypothetical protein